ncbi:MAG: zf-HC2 domain-containing protein [Armatimonadetes bacterium]|nr:zf-HC2 domain-containing protein [Armatimonadota bacterium]MDE2205108.1 zf-HC2 domain-containing protein [Armatimonadota bacterium]
MASTNRMQTECDAISALLPGLAGDQLSTREAWRVERHLPNCTECAALARQYYLLADALRSAPGHDTGLNFMARLHERLDVLEPVRAHHRVGDMVRGWLGGLLPATAQVRRPVIGLGVAAALTGAAVLMMWPAGAPQLTAISQTSLARNTAITASNPFDDPVAAQLQARSAATAARTTSE